MEKKLKNIIIYIVILILIALNIGVFIKNNFEKNTISEQEQKLQQIQNIYNLNQTSETKQKSLNEIEESLDAKVSSLAERERMQRYFGKFINAIENKNYTSAYNMLNENFKNTYFETQEKFEQYITTKYPTEFIIVEYNNIQREGELFILTVKILDGMNQQFESFEQRIVIRENNANDFTLSFQVV